MDKFIGFFRNVTILLFTGTLIWSYAYLASQSDYSYDFEGIVSNADKNSYWVGFVPDNGEDKVVN